MKKTISIFLAFCTIFCFTFALSGCSDGSEKCSHLWNLVSDTATCENAGVKTYECAFCEETRAESSLAIGHDWKQISSTATCTSGGKVTYRCNYCRKTKQESVQATGHSYQYGTCKTCGQFEYNISLSIDSPLGYGFRYSSGIHYWSKIEIREISFEVIDGDLYATCYGIKTYDKDGEYGTSAIMFKFVLYDSNDNIIASGTSYTYGVIPNQQFSESLWIRVVDKLSPDEKYVLKLVSDIS